MSGAEPCGQAADPAAARTVSKKQQLQEREQKRIRKLRQSGLLVLGYTLCCILAFNVTEGWSPFETVRRQRRLSSAASQTAHRPNAA